MKSTNVNRRTWRRTTGLTKAEQKGINRQQNRISRSIYNDKHEAK